MKTNDAPVPSLKTGDHCMVRRKQSRYRGEEIPPEFEEAIVEAAGPRGVKILISCPPCKQPPGLYGLDPHTSRPHYMLMYDLGVWADMISAVRYDVKKIEKADDAAPAPSSPTAQALP